jgi:hypothetical protein
MFFSFQFALLRLDDTHTQTETEVLNKFSQLSTEICFVWHFMFQVAPPKGGWEGATYFSGESFVLSQPWGVMHRIQWDPERYDYLSDHPFWLSTWSVWDLSERGAYIEVRCFSFLSG